MGLLLSFLNLPLRRPPFACTPHMGACGDLALGTTAAAEWVVAHRSLRWVPCRAVHWKGPFRTQNKEWDRTPLRLWGRRVTGVGRPAVGRAGAEVAQLMFWSGKCSHQKINSLKSDRVSNDLVGGDVGEGGLGIGEGWGMDGKGEKETLWKMTPDKAQY